MEKHFWVLFIVATVANGLIFKFRSRKYIKENPELKDGYDILFKGWIFYGNIPWVIMGIGVMTGMVESVFEFFDIGGLKPIVVLFYLSVVVLWILGSRWIYFRGGAEMLSKHPGFLTVGFSAVKISPFWVKALWTLMLVSGIFGFTMMLMGQLGFFAQ